MSFGEVLGAKDFEPSVWDLLALIDADTDGELLAEKRADHRRNNRMTLRYVQPIRAVPCEHACGWEHVERVGRPRFYVGKVRVPKAVWSALRSRG